MTRIYTRTGDQGATGLIGGQRRSKADLRIQCIGEVDELNAWLGLLRAGLAESDAQAVEMIREIQGELFELGAELAAPQGLARLGADQVSQVEAWIDRLDDALPPLRSFILPGGGEWAAQAHIARAVCRRAERALSALRDREPLPSGSTDHGQRYLNRLSDWLFVLARTLAHRQGEETPWLPRG